MTTQADGTTGTTEQTEQPGKLMALPPEREAELPAIRDKWIAIGLRTGPGDPARAWAGIKAAYVEGGREEPKLHLWTRSLREAALACALLETDQGLANIERAMFWPGPADAATRVHDGEAVDREAIVDTVLQQVARQLCEQIPAETRAALDMICQPTERTAPDLDGLWARAGEYARRWWVPGQWDAAWLAYYDALREYGPVHRLKPLMEVAESCYCAHPFPNIVVFSAPPTALHRDAEGRLHHESEAAASFADGFSVYAWHGTRVPAEVILRPASITAERVLGETNQEVRRVMLERFGPGNLVRALGAEPIDSSDFGTLYRVTLPGEETPRAWVSVVDASPEPDGTYKTYWLSVPPEMERAREAIAWTMRMEEHEYQPEIQT